MCPSKRELHEALLPYLSAAEWAKRGSFGFDDYGRRAAANAERDPDALSLLEIEFQLHSRIGPCRESATGESSALEQALEFGKLLTVVKNRVGPGAFDPWVRAFCLFSPRTAARYGRAARGSGV